MNSSTSPQSTSETIFDPFPGDEVLVIAFETVHPAIVLGSTRSVSGEELYHVFLTTPDEDEDVRREFYARRYELAEV